MWARNLLFVGVCVAGLAALVASLSPLHTRARHEPARRDAQQVDFASAVARLDASFNESWQQSRVLPAPRATSLAIARRLSLALTGTIPSLAEIRELETQPSDAVVSWWFDRLWADRRTSDYLAERLARAYVGTQDGPFLIYRRRRFVSWLADELHANRPYDQIVTQLIATDGLWTSKPATNFITVTAMPDQQRGPDPNLLAARVTRAFIGVRLDCAECHDHPFQPWRQEQFQALAGFFARTQNSLRGIRDVAGPVEVENPATASRLSVVPAVPFAAELLPAEGPTRERLARWVTSPENRAFAHAAANRAWALMCGRPLVEPIDDIPAENVPRPLAILAEDFVQHGYDLRRLLTLIAHSGAFQRDSRAVDDSSSATQEDVPQAEWATFPLTRLRPEQVVGSLLQSASLATLDHESHIVLRFARAVGQSEFVKHYGDSGEDEFAPQVGTIPQRLLLMNGQLVYDKTKDNLVNNAATQIAALASSDEKAVEIAYLACLTRRPSDAERQHFVGKLSHRRGRERRQQMEDLYWALLNSTEFSWNH